MAFVIQAVPSDHIDLWCRRNIIAGKENRNFALRDRDGNEIGIFTGKAPRQAALKAANRGYTDIKLRERKTKKVHVFIGGRKQIKKPKRAHLHGCLQRAGNPVSRRLA